tara:strand:- start:60 stop:635 length:576 start_codon:yes stop_codon:yes gene_type:complete
MALTKEQAKEQFDYWTNKLSLNHTFSFDEAWDFAQYSRLKKTLNNLNGFKKSNYTAEQFKEGIKTVEERIKESDRSFNGKDIDNFNPLKHSFGDGIYVREIFNPAGELLVTKIHKYNHPYFLLSGEMSILDEEGEKRIIAPHYGITKAGTKRIIYAHTNCIFVTVHATDKKDVREIEKDILLDNFLDEEKE